MNAILYVGHGSRVQAGNQELISFIESVKVYFKEIPIQEHAFIELAAPSIAEGITACIEKGATRIAVVPVLLLTANHAKLDIPREIDEAKKRYPHVHFVYGRPFGVEATLISILKKRLEQKGLPMITARPEEEEREEAMVLVVGRGSSDPDANSDLMKISRLLWEEAPIADVEVCYIAATRPTVDQGLKRIMRFPYKKVYVLPYLLFTGVLMKGLEKKLDQWSAKTGIESVLCSYLGFDDDMKEVLIRRVEEVLNEAVLVNCDMCQYRLTAEEKRASSS
ncbi:sirohydrochlorin chelatase [Alkalihalophilus lindianensis]|uniref:Sirohydrochlorin chelatase n=1 Tax=Alkalihalophilus lindianensis TaxID=1630542 RepID=A0ABU3X5W7_9BACI|nr:sirohydrochlorin chelatase [Alkalihalophilus lindianensis]MDV2683274.1 sirohydrochlorin chelatase [Alkalihalophilus lindianensis]